MVHSFRLLWPTLLLPFLLSISVQAAQAPSGPVRVRPCPRSTWLVAKAHQFKSGPESADRDEIPIQFNEIIDGVFDIFATPSDLKSVITFYSEEFEKQGFRDRREYTGLAEHMKGRYQRGSDLGWVSAQRSGDPRLYRFLAPGQKIPRNFNLVMVAIGKDVKAPAVAPRETGSPVLLPFKPFPGSVAMTVRTPRFADGASMRRQFNSVPDAYGMLRDGEADAFAATGDMKKIFSFYTEQLIDLGYTKVQEKTTEPDRFVAVYQKGGNAVAMELIRRPEMYKPFLAPGQVPAQDSIMIFLARGRSNFL